MRRRKMRKQISGGSEEQSPPASFEEMSSYLELVMSVFGVLGLVEKLRASSLQL